MIKSKFLSVSSMNTLLAILKVTDARRDVILAGGLYHRFPWRHLPPPPTWIWRKERRNVSFRYYGSIISRSQESFLTEAAICIIERWKKRMGWRFAPQCNHAHESNTCQFFLPYLQDCGLPRSRSFSTGVEEGGFCRGGLLSPQGGAIYSHKKGWFLAGF